MKLDRNIQRQILEKLQEAFPSGIYQLPNQFEPPLDEEIAIANIQYLHQHGLVESGYLDRELVGYSTSQRWAEPRETCITAKGIDFLMDDGGLGAILGVITVKLEATTIMSLVTQRIDQADDLTHGEKSHAKILLRSAGDQAIRKFVDMVMERGLQAVEKTPQLIGMLQGVLS